MTHRVTPLTLQSLASSLWQTSRVEYGTSRKELNVYKEAINFLYQCAPPPPTSQVHKCCISAPVLSNILYSLPHSLRVLFSRGVGG